MSTRIACRTLLMMTLAFSSTAWGVHMPEWIHRCKNPKSDLETAKGRENHAAVAAYYKAKADALDAQADAYEKAAAAYRSGPYVKNLMAQNQAARYDCVAKRLRKEARSYREREKSEEDRASNAQALDATKSQLSKAQTPGNDRRLSICSLHLQLPGTEPLQCHSEEPQATKSSCICLV